MQQKSARAAVVILGLAGIIYNSWPLGFLLNKSIAYSSLASDLEAPGQPYNWVFIGGDVTVALLILITAIIMRSKLKAVFWRKPWSVVLIGTLIFGLFTATSAFATSHCNSTPAICASLNQRVLGPDGIESTIGSLGLFASLIAAIFLSVRYKLSRRLTWLAWLTLVAWSAAGLLFLWAAGVNKHIELAQQFLLVLTGFGLLSIGLLLNAAFVKLVPQRHS